jgi:uncharacterized membrane protein (UPF0127 family)
VLCKISSFQGTTLFMSLTNILRAAGVALLLSFAPACAQTAPADGRPDVRQLPMEDLTIDTAHGPVRFHVEIADDDQEREQGLMYRRSMAADHGMLFDFNPPQQVAFWMHNTVLSLDIIFIGADGRVLNIAANATPFSDANLPSEGLARGVLEINAGRAQALGILPGSVVHHRIFNNG